MGGCDEGEAALWVVYGIDQAPGEEQRALLSPDEEVRSLAFTSEGARWRFIWMRAALRVILAEQLGVTPQQLNFAYGAQGKPRLLAPALAHRCSFSISHSHGTGVVLVLRQPSNALKPAAPVGVDLEHHRTRRFSSLARRFFLPGESIALSSAAEQG